MVANCTCDNCVRLQKRMARDCERRVDPHVFSEAHHKGDQKLGAGAYRTVYAYDAESVVKIERVGSYYSTSASEIRVWETFKDSPDARFLARVIEHTYQEGSNDLVWTRMERVVRTFAQYAAEKKGGKLDGYDFISKNGRQIHFTGEAYTGDAYVIMGWPEIQEVRGAADRMGIGDIHAWNIGQRSDGSWCIIDYGC